MPFTKKDFTSYPRFTSDARDNRSIPSLPDEARGFRLNSNYRRGVIGFDENS